MPTSTPPRLDAERKPRPIAPRPISEVARDLGLGDAEWIPYGHTKAKVHVAALAARRDRPDGKLVVVSSITPTPAGDGKTTMTIGLGEALRRIGAHPVIALREPSIGPTLSMKGARSRSTTCGSRRAPDSSWPSPGTSPPCPASRGAPTRNGST